MITHGSPFTIYLGVPLFSLIHTLYKHLLLYLCWRCHCDSMKVLSFSHSLPFCLYLNDCLCVKYLINKNCQQSYSTIIRNCLKCVHIHILLNSVNMPELLQILLSLTSTFFSCSAFPPPLSCMLATRYGQINSALLFSLHLQMLNICISYIRLLSYTGCVVEGGVFHKRRLMSFLQAFFLLSSQRTGQKSTF